MLHFYSPVLPLFQLPVDARLARFNMVEQQIRPFGVLDSAVVGLLHHIDRQRFVPDAYRSLAYADIEIPIGQNQYMMEPKLEARLLQALAPKPGERILEIGTGSGFMAALLAAAGAEVTSVEIFADLSARATQTILDVGFAAVRTVVGDGSQGWPEGGLGTASWSARRPLRFRTPCLIRWRSTGGWLRSSARIQRCKRSSCAAAPTAVSTSNPSLRPTWRP